MKARVRGKLVGDQLGGEETRNVNDLPTGDTEEEGDGVEDISEDQLDREVVDRKTLPDPGE